ncbi:MAG: preprotein translocase subunit SecG [Betaproteobacteria bacterium]|nr:preprotein translocase subunit SecG [Betaproteobacteria bacterium]
MEQVVWVVHVLTAISVIGLVLMQHGKGADMGAAFGSGASGSLFGATGSANFLSRTTAVLATLFFLTSVGLTALSAKTKTLNTAVPAEVSPVSAPAGAVPAAAPASVPAAPAGAIPK